MNDDSLRQLKGIGEKTEKLFERAGISNLNQLLHYYPRDYDSFERPIALGNVEAAKINAIVAHVTAAPSIKNAGGKSITILSLSDDTGKLKVMWFNMPFLRSTLKKGSVFVFRGQVAYMNGQLMMEHPQIYTMAQYDELMGQLQPIYPLVSGLTNKMVTGAMKKALDIRTLQMDYLPYAIKEVYGLCDLNYAISEVHFPKNMESLLVARKRLVFDEFFFFLLALASLKDQTEEKENHFPMKAVWKTEEVIENLPYRLTRGQLRCWNDLENDLKGNLLMNRLIQGDVGSGKTILAFLSMIQSAENGYQSALMVPTEVLAAQHYQALCGLLEENGLQDMCPVLLTGSLRAAKKREVYDKIASSQAKMIIGTHALIQEKVQYKELALVITDEQHRFGVRQRGVLSEKGYPPNVLVMSATPIPRTLAIILYGDLHISVLDELPSKRKPIKCCVVNTSYRPNAYRFMKKQIEMGHQVYVICPMVEESEEVNAEDVISYSRKLKNDFPDDISIQPLHGRMKASEKDAIMDAFAKNKIQILVSTTVVEVGVNVPNATVMLIENAERFGLAQLHQLRGRVGRGEDQSYCIFMQGDGKEEISKRLDILAHSNDGFYIANEDLKLRGPGDLFGIRQSGEMIFQIADIYQDSTILLEASEASKRLLAYDPALSEKENKVLKSKLDEYIEQCTSMLML